MAQIIVRNLPEETKARLAARAKRAGRSMEEEARAILNQSTFEKTSRKNKKGMGDHIAAYFKKTGFTKKEKKSFDASLRKARRQPLPPAIDFPDA